MTNTYFAPNPTAPDDLAVYEGQKRVGRLIRHGNNFEAVDINGTSHGTFDSMKRAAFALPKQANGGDS
jgi:hypothetical protein